MCYVHFWHNTTSNTFDKWLKHIIGEVIFIQKPYSNIQTWMDEPMKIAACCLAVNIVNIV